jgi:hypothetical protein
LPIIRPIGSVRAESGLGPKFIGETPPRTASAWRRCRLSNIAHSTDILNARNSVLAIRNINDETVEILAAGNLARQSIALTAFLEPLD